MNENSFVFVQTVPISESSDGTINMEHLELALQAWSSQSCQIIGCFSAASNITG